MDSKALLSFLSQISSKPLQVLDASIPITSYFPIDISESNPQLQTFDVSSSQAWENYIANYLDKHDAKVAYGGYLEYRNIYRRSGHFSQSRSEEERNIHLGMDLWTQAGTSVLAVLDGKVHSFKNNDKFGDYGPTIILEHDIYEERFYSLYGHLSLESLEFVEIGQKFKQGDVIGSLGTAEVNGDYAPHLHFQIIRHMNGLEGDFPGVCSKKNLDNFRENCPDPNVLLKLN